MKSPNALFPLIFLTIAGCGGSGSSATPQQPPTTSVSITSANAGTATKASWEAANSSAGMSDLLGSTGVVAATPGGLAKPKWGTLGTASLLSVVQKIPFGPDVFPCQVGGSLTLSGDLANPLTLTMGDTFNVDADMCDDGLGEVIDGLLAFTVDEFAGDLFAGAYLLTMTMNLTNFQVSTVDDVITSNGDATVSLDTRVASAVTATVSGTSLTTDTNSASATLSNYNSMQTIDIGMQPATYTLNSQGTLNTSELAGTVSYTTPETFVGFDTDYPHDGTLEVVGENSSAYLIAVDEINVRIEIDSDGDGTIDETINTTWAELTS